MTATTHRLATANDVLTLGPSAFDAWLAERPEGERYFAGMENNGALMAWVRDLTGLGSPAITEQRVVDRFNANYLAWPYQTPDWAATFLRGQREREKAWTNPSTGAVEDWARGYSPAQARDLLAAALAATA